MAAQCHAVSINLDLHFVRLAHSPALEAAASTQ